MVIKFTPAGRVQWVFGRRQESAEEAKPWEHVDPPLPARDGLFPQPTDVAWDSRGNIYITDGYVDSRVAKYDRNGDWVKQWGTKGSGPAQFNTPHSIVIDRDDHVYVAIAAIAGSRCSMPTATSCGSGPSTSRPTSARARSTD